MPKDISIAVIRSDTEIYGRRPVPLILGFDEQHGISKPELDRALVGFVAGITFHAELHGSLYHSLARTLLDAPAFGRIG
jgi:hypothetical protein